MHLVEPGWCKCAAAVHPDAKVCGEHDLFWRRGDFNNIELCSFTVRGHVASAMEQHGTQLLSVTALWFADSAVV